MSGGVIVVAIGVVVLARAAEAHVTLIVLAVLATLALLSLASPLAPASGVLPAPSAASLGHRRGQRGEYFGAG